MNGVKKSSGTKVKEPKKANFVNINEFKEFLGAIQLLSWRLKVYKLKAPGTTSPIMLYPFTIKTLNKLVKLTNQWGDPNGY